MTHARRTRTVDRIRVYCPVTAETLTAMIAGEHDAIERDPTLSSMLAIVRDDNPLGDFGPYRSVVEMMPGWEMFTPEPSARPTLGAAGCTQVSPSVVMTIHVPTDVATETLDDLLARLIAAHPWEVPVIELSRVDLLIRG